MQDGIVGQSLGRYHVVAPLGEGGMASVYQAYDLNLERNVAIKIIRVDMNQDSGFLRRFEREARALAKLDHPYILKVLDYGEERGLPYLVMPFMDGGTLKEVKKPMPYREAARLLLPIAQALAYAHKEGIIHRDLKPANILISKSGEPILSDFGIAKMLDTGESTQLTGTGMSIGTPDYMAPEQWMGTSNAQTDVYALGVVFYELLTGRRPFIADTPAAVFLKHREDPLPDPRRFVPEIPTGAMQILYNALAKKPQDRFHDMASFAMALDQLIHAQDGAVTVLSAPDAVDTMIAVEPPAAKKLPRGKLILIAASALVVIGLLCGGMIWLGVKNDWFGGTAADPTEAQTEISLNRKITPTPQDQEQAPTSAPTSAPSPTPERAQPFTEIEGLDEDIPVLLDNNGDLVTSEAQEMTMWMFTTDLTLEEVVEFYEGGMAATKWQLLTRSEVQASDTVIYYYQEGQRFLQISLVEEEDGLMVSLMRQENP